MGDDIKIIGAREHNLKNVSVTIPRGKLTVVTGLSGSGKSSLAFDTLYAEGQRRYVESLSAYARQFLNQMQKPNVDNIIGLSPAISISQRNSGSNPRSIVATSTEIHDYLRLLFSAIGQPHCPKCGDKISSQNAEEIVEVLMNLDEKTKVMLLAPVVDGRKGNHDEVFNGVKRQGFTRVRVDGEICSVDEVPELAKTKKHNIDIVIDRLVINNKIRSRITDSIELALKFGEGQMIGLIDVEGKWEDIYFSEKYACSKCKLSFKELTSRTFSFNSPYGACPHCSGLGELMIFDEELVVPDKSLSIDAGALHAWRRGGRRMILYYKRLINSACDAFEIDRYAPFEDIPEEKKNWLLYGTDFDVTLHFWRRRGARSATKKFEGLVASLHRRFQETDSDAARARLRGYMSSQVCPVCNGARLRPEVLACTVDDMSIADITFMSVKNGVKFFKELELKPGQEKIVGEVLSEIKDRLKFLLDVGLEYITLDRKSGSLSGGEMQRIRLATQIGSGLVGVLYVLDEPTIGLHLRDNDRLIQMLRELRNIGNTVVVVEHDEQMIREADYIIDMGPLAGSHGGEVVFEGDINQLLKSKKSITAQYLRGENDVDFSDRRISVDLKQALVVRNASQNNLHGIDVMFPLGVFTCVTGVSGSGKSTLVDYILKRGLFRHFHGSREHPGKHDGIDGLDLIDKVILIDQSPIGRTPRSNPVTYTGTFSIIRNLFAETTASKIRGYKPGRYSFNVKGGRCETCKGDGYLKLEMHFLPDVYVPCEKCNSSRYNKETLEIQYRNKNIADVLDMTIEEALEFFENIPGIKNKLQTLMDVGLGYLKLGQSSTTLSGGEAQRIKLASELSKRATGKTLYLLDEPTTGLHFADVSKLLKILLKLRDSGNTIIVIEHNLDVIKTSDYIIDLGPEGGEKGGKIIATGTPEEVAKCKKSFTGQFLKKIL
ncbi:MAG: excinuclease ABC subunit UvrA [Kiritimatiellae bacterium]|nr:excinuclease ABC subunit UvrA [Kiritimatiellia bacterium]